MPSYSIREALVSVLDLLKVAGVAEQVGEAHLDVISRGPLAMP